MVCETGKVLWCLSICTAMHQSIDIIPKSNIFKCCTSFECRLPNSSLVPRTYAASFRPDFIAPHSSFYFWLHFINSFQPFSALDVIPFKHQVSITISLVKNRFLSSFLSMTRALYNTLDDGEIESERENESECRTVNKCLKQFYSWKSVWSILKWSIKWLR